MMPAQMSKTERVTAALNGRAADRPPVSAWWHDYKREWSAADLAEATLEYYRKYGWDYIKVNPRFSYYAEDWGATYRRYAGVGVYFFEAPVTEKKRSDRKPVKKSAGGRSKE